MARAYARIVTAPAGTAEHRVATAMRDHPWFVAGTGTLVTQLGLAVPGLLAKNGAEGGFAAALPAGGRWPSRSSTAPPALCPPSSGRSCARSTSQAPAPDPVLGGPEPVGRVLPAF